MYYLALTLVKVIIKGQIKKHLFFKIIQSKFIHCGGPEP